jgi:hypothetical protein
MKSLPPRRRVGYSSARAGRHRPADDPPRPSRSSAWSYWSWSTACPGLDPGSRRRRSACLGQMPAGSHAMPSAPGRRPADPARRPQRPLFQCQAKQTQREPDQTDARLDLVRRQQPPTQSLDRRVAMASNMLTHRRVERRQLRRLVTALRAAVVSPVVRRRVSTLDTYGTLTRSRSATSPTRSPSSDAANTRSRRSCEYALPR